MRADVSVQAKGRIVCQTMEQRLKINFLQDQNNAKVGMQRHCLTIESL